MVRRAIQAYDPDEAHGTPTPEELERDIVVAVLNHITNAMRSTRESVEHSNARATETLSHLNDLAQRGAIAKEARREIVENPGFLDEVSDLF